ncbi:hypothetical protein N8783_05185 [Alphaproteobacteria bacterium]|nr:hypothetical protein [Alphaproteobacteria bacterium]
MFRLFSIVILLVVSGVNSSWGNSTGSPRKCIFELYQFRSPVISGCSLQYNSNGLTEVYVYSKKGQFGQEDQLNQLMREAFSEITQSRSIKVKYNRNLTKRQLYAHGAEDKNWFLDMIASLQSPDKTGGYKLRLGKHKAWLDTLHGFLSHPHKNKKA